MHILGHSIGPAGLPRAHGHTPPAEALGARAVLPSATLPRINLEPRHCTSTEHDTGRAQWSRRPVLHSATAAALCVAEFGSMGSRRCLRRRGRAGMYRASCSPAGPAPHAARGLSAVLARAGPADGDGPEHAHGSDTIDYMPRVLR